MRAPAELAEALHSARDGPQAIELLREIGLLAAEEDDSEFARLLGEILDRDDVAGAAVACWLSDPSGEQAAQQILREYSVRYLQTHTPAKVDLAFVSPEAAILAARRMNRMAAAPAFVLGWVAETLRQWPTEESVLNGCDSVLHYLVTEYPDPMHDLMSTLTSGSFAAEPWQLIQHYLDQLREERSTVSAFTWLREFEMSSREAEVLRVLRQKTNDQIVRQAESQSVFAQFAVRFRFKYSHRVLVPAGESETSIEMQELGAETHLPLSEWCDPLEGIRARRALWSGDAE